VASQSVTAAVLKSRFCARARSRRGKRSPGVVTCTSSFKVAGISRVGLALSSTKLSGPSFVQSFQGLLGVVVTTK